MPHVSKRFLEQEIFRKINLEFILLLSKLSTRDLKIVMYGLFTKTERLMLAKRLAITCLIFEGVSYSEIYTVLKISPSTVGRLSSSFNQGKYDAMLKIFRRKRNREIFWNTLEKILQAGLPPRGKGRWKWLYQKHQ
jgi:uncharacterized protein YerC